MKVDEDMTSEQAVAELGKWLGQLLSEDYREWLLDRMRNIRPRQKSPS